MFEKFLSGIFNSSDYDFDEVHVHDEVIDSILHYARSADPNEFMALLDGRIDNKVLIITGLIFLPVESSYEGVIMNTGMLPVTMKNWGSVHSHPGPSALPSNTDLDSFAKRGVFHMIVCRPYGVDDIMAYNKYGENISYKIVKTPLDELI
ncbi:MAG: Mov34/MPN/PAD-1 family protein [Methanobrevibacter sp.]|jgi:proteasome lid subunit RPN8/RPN11|nr:Mov34/MPN/PAD-1 family protein [Candidatus Methanovirga aequatorialis]